MPIVIILILIMLVVVMLNVCMLSAIFLNALILKCRYADVIMLNAFRLCDAMPGF